MSEYRGVGGNTLLVSEGIAVLVAIADWSGSAFGFSLLPAFLELDFFAFWDVLLLEDLEALLDGIVVASSFSLLTSTFN